METQPLYRERLTETIAAAGSALLLVAYATMFWTAMLAEPETYCDPSLPCATGEDWRSTSGPVAKR